MSDEKCLDQMLSMIRKSKARADQLREAHRDAESAFRGVCIAVHEELGLGPKDGIDIDAGVIVRAGLEE